MGVANCKTCTSSNSQNFQEIIHTEPNRIFALQSAQSARQLKRHRHQLQIYQGEVDTSGLLAKNIPNNLEAKVKKTIYDEQVERRMITCDSENESIKNTETDQITISMNRMHLVDNQQQSDKQTCTLFLADGISSARNKGFMSQHSDRIESLYPRKSREQSSRSKRYCIDQIILRHRLKSTEEVDTDGSHWVPSQQVQARFDSSNLKEFVQTYLPNSSLLKIQQHKWSISDSGSYICGVVSQTSTSTVMTCLLPDSRMYYGEIEGYIPNGIGILISSNATIFRGIFKQGCPQGKGLFQNLLQKVYIEGNWQAGRLLKGRWKTPKSQYEGYFNQKGQPNGKGFYTDLQNGTFYQGEFRNGNFEGLGLLGTHKSLFKGYFQKGKRHGKGQLESFQGPNRGVTIGEWRKDKLVQLLNP